MDRAQDFFERPLSPFLGSGATAAQLAPDGHPASANTSGLKTQLAISIALGLGSFLAFCALRTRWPIIFAPRTKLRRHTPPKLSPKFFGWIKELLKIEESVVLDCVGLDAAMMLRFFSTSALLFGLCMIPGILIILPVNTYSTFDGRLPTDPDEGNDRNDPSFPGAEPKPGTSLLYLFTQFTFAWLFSLLTIYSAWYTYEGYIEARRQYLLKREKAIVNRTVMVVGLPVHLQSDRALATFYESLQVGTVESAHIGRHVRKLKRLIEQRAHALKALELAYAKYYGNPSKRADYDPDAIAAENDKCLEHHHHHHTSTATATTAAAVSLGESPSQETSRGSLQEPDERSSLVPRTGNNKRPTMRLGFMGIFGRKVDKINHLREVFATLDKAVQKMRMSRVYAATSIGFVTFEDMQSAQILAQTVNTKETLSCETFLAPEPRDVYWDNLNLPPSEIAVRTVVVNVVCFFLVFFWAGPVSVFSSFLNLDSLDKIFPGISKIAGKNRILKSLIQGFLPTVGVIIFLTVVPRILLSLCRRQGMQSHSEIEQSLYNKYFTFILFNVVLVFTIVGTWAQAFDKVYHNLGELTLILAASLPRVAPFFVNYTILRGVGLFPLQLLQIGDVFGHIFQGFISKTPRDYAEARAPPELPYGVVYSNATLVFVVILIYSCIKPLILVFGALYFTIGAVVFKYQVLYVYFHPHESSGQMWPMVYNRLTLGLVTFQLTMLGLFMLKQAYVFGAFLAPLPIGTVWFWYWTTATYKQTAKFIPLQLLQPDDHTDPSGARFPQASEQRSSLDSGTLVGGHSAILHSSDGHKLKTAPLHNGGQGNFESNRSSTTAIEVDSSSAAPPSSLPTVVITPGGTRRRIPKSAVDEDDYQSAPDRFTDYRQPPMTFYYGVLNSGMRHYAHPALSGPLPTLWLPLQKGEGSLGSVGKGARRPHLGDEEATTEGHDWTMVTAMDPDQPQTYDEGDNLAGGGQDEEDAEGSETASDTQDQDGSQMEGQAPRQIMDDHDGSSNNTRGGPSLPESSSDGSARPMSSSRNSALEGINDVYYHHPERRLSNASAGSSRRRGTVGSETGGWGSGNFPPRSLPGRGLRVDLLRDQGQSGSGPPASAPANVRRS